MTAIDPRPLDILDGDFYVNDPYSRYAWLRENDPVHWDEINQLWVITRYDDIVAVEKDKATFINSGAETGYRPNIGADASIIGLDDPLHTARRMLVARRFTPRAVGKWEDHVRDVVSAQIDAALAKDDTEVIDDLASPIPAMMIGLLLGFPDEMWKQLREWSERTIQLGGGPRYFDEDGVLGAMEFAGACAELYESKKECPADDVMSLWISIEEERGGSVGDSPFGLDQIISDCLLLLDGGAETTRTVLARAVLALADQPELFDQLRSGADLTLATDEFIRWVTPIHNFTRTATRDVDVNGTTIAEGQAVVLCYGSANRDETHFERPDDIVLDRSPNNHLAFGFGTHFCLGASLARLEIKTFLEELIARVSSIERLADQPHVEMPNAFVYGLKESHVRLTPA